MAVIENCNHFYVGVEDKINKIVCDWIEEVLS